MVSKFMLIFKFYTHRHDLDPNQMRRKPVTINQSDHKKCDDK